MTVVIPARNESDSIGSALAALRRQRDLHGQPLQPDVFDIIVFANNCSDTTAKIARAVAISEHGAPISVVERNFPATDAHIGAARKYVMDLAAERLLEGGKPEGLIASTDSDTIVDQQWVAWTLHEARSADAIAGHVAINEADQAQLLAPVRLLYARELAYRRAIAEIEALLDPVPEDPLPRHSSFVGASFAVKASTYIAAGKLPPLRRLEDFHFCRALRRIDARVRHSPFVRATTSARLAARVSGGFGTFIASLHVHAERGETFCVEHPQQTIDTFRQRAALRRVWHATRRICDGPVLSRRERRMQLRWRTLLGEAATFGLFCEGVAAADSPQAHPELGVDSAIEIIRAFRRLLVASETGFLRPSAGQAGTRSGLAEYAL